MKKAPDAAAIHDAEQRFFQSSRLVYSGLGRVRSTFRHTVSRPSMLVKVAGLTGVFCFWLARRTRLKPPTPVKSILDTMGTSALGLMLAAILRDAIRRLGVIFR